MALAGAALLSLAGARSPGAGSGSPVTIVAAGWSAYIVGLFLVGLGLAWTATVGILHRSGLAAAALNLLQSGLVLLAICGKARPVADPAAMSAARLAALSAFAILSIGAVGRRLSVALAIVAGAGCLEALSRALRPGAAANATMDAVLVMCLAVTLALLARRLRHLEDDWAGRNRGDRRTDFSEFNNPQHQWNRPDDGPGLSCARSVS